METNEIKNFRNALKNAIMESFFKGKYSVAIIKNFDKIKREYTYSIEPTRDLMLAILGEIQWVAIEFGYSVDFATNYEVVNGKIIFTATLELLKDGIVVLRNKAFGEASEMVINTTDGSVSNDPFAIRSAETRAIKRLVEILAPAIGLTLKVVSLKLTEFMARAPQNANPMAFVIEKINSFEQKFYENKNEYEKQLGNEQNAIDIFENEDTTTKKEIKQTAGKAIIKTKDGEEKIFDGSSSSNIL
jgi:hypothetical protein